MASVRKLATEVVTTLKERGYTAYFAGGFVRDLLLGISSSDIDIATNALPHEIAALFPEHILVGAQFGVCIVRHKRHQFEVATFRHDVEYQDGRRPTEIALKSTPAEDAHRRDFTINGMFYDPLTEEVLDYVDGQRDLEHKIIRTIGNPQDRFQEDRLRMLRAIRFARRFDFAIESETASAIKKLSHSLLPSVSMERIWQEFVKMHKAQNFCQALIDMAELGLLQTIFPPLLETSPDTIKMRIKGVEQVSERVPSILVLCQLFSPQDLSFVLGLAIYLRASKEETKDIEHFLELKSLWQTDPALSNLYEWAHLFASSRASASCEVFLAQLEPAIQFKSKKQLEGLQERLSFHIDCIKHRKPLCQAKDLEPFGVRPGKRMGKILDYAERIAIMEDLKSKEVILNRLKQDPILTSLNDEGLR